MLSQPLQRVDKLFAMMDKDKNAQLSFEEFQEGSKKGECQQRGGGFPSGLTARPTNPADPTIVQALSLYDGLV